MLGPRPVLLGLCVSMCPDGLTDRECVHPLPRLETCGCLCWHCAQSAFCFSAFDVVVVLLQMNMHCFFNEK